MKFETLIRYLNTHDAKFFSDLSITLNGEGDLLIADLKKLGISKCSKTQDGVKVDFIQNDFCLFENFASAIGKVPLLKNIPNDIVILSEKQSFSRDTIRKNYDSYNKIKDSLKDYNIAAFDDKLNSELVFLSTTHGELKLNYSYQGYESLFFTDDLSALQSRIETAEHNELAGIFKDTLVDIYFVKGLEKNFFELVKNFSIFENSYSRNVRLYQSKFSFEQFKTDFNQAKEEFLQSYATFYAGFMPKIYGVPLQIGIYTVLFIKVAEQNIPLLSWAFLFAVILTGFYSNSLITTSLKIIRFSIDEFRNKVKQAEEATQIPLQNELDAVLKSVSAFVRGLTLFRCINFATHATYAMATITLLAEVDVGGKTTTLFNWILSLI